MAGAETDLTRRYALAALVPVNELAAHLDDPDWIVVDCRFDLADPGAGRAAWRRGHVPGAAYADLDRDLAAPARADGTGGRHPLPDPDELNRRLRSWGIRATSRVVAYDDAGNAIAARLWWLLRWLGHERAAVLDGGLTAWQAAGRPLSTDESAPPAGNFEGTPGAMPISDADAVAEGLASGRIALLDARAAERFAGFVEPLDTRAGHVPGAVSTPFQDNLRADKCLRAPEELRAYYSAAIGDARDVVAMCGSGVTACHTLLALEVAGMPVASLYAGSWSDWISSAERPIARSSDLPE